LTNALPENRVHLLMRHLKNERESRGLGDVPEAGHLLQCRLRLGRQTDELRNHEVDNIFAITLGVNATEIPRPARGIMIEREHLFSVERKNELNREEGIAPRFLVH